MTSSCFNQISATVDRTLLKSLNRGHLFQKSGMALYLSKMSALARIPGLGSCPVREDQYKLRLADESQEGGFPCLKIDWTQLTRQGVSPHLCSFQASKDFLYYHKEIVQLRPTEERYPRHRENFVRQPGVNENSWVISSIQDTIGQ